MRVANCRYEVVFQHVDQHTGSKWLTHGNKQHKDNH